MGHSDGGSIAIIIASQYPSIVEKLILIAAHIYIEPKMTKGLRVIQIASKSSPLKDVLELEHGRDYQSLVQAWISCWSKHGRLSLDLQGELSNVSCPTLAIQGEKDEHATPQHVEDIVRGIKDANLWLIPKVGHMPPHEIPEQFNDRVIQFLIENKSAQVPVNEIGTVRDNVQ
jgi:pimeloyl-ACP methyl ester carboxylesterase